MADQAPSLFARLPDAHVGDWRRRAAKELGEIPVASLRSHLAGDLTVEPFYSDAVEATPPPGMDDTTRGARTDDGGPPTRLGLLIQADDAGVARAAIGEAIADHLSLLWLRLGPACFATKAAVRDWIEGQALAGRSLVIDADGGTAAAASSLLEACDGHVPWTDGADITFAVDPLDALASGKLLAGELDRALDAMGDLAVRCHQRAGAWRAVTVDTAIHRAAGATASDELAAAIASGLRYLRGLSSSGLSAGAAAEQIRFVLSLGSDVFIEIAKLRALRHLWSRCLAVLGVEKANRGASIYARTAAAERTIYGRWANQLRATAEGFAALVGGAEGLVLSPFEASAQGRRLAVTAQHILTEEAQLARVRDPAGGSGYVEELTDQLARAAWVRVRSIEQRGGMEAVLMDGSLGAAYAAEANQRAMDVAHGRERWVGVSVFPHATESLPKAVMGDASAHRGPLVPRRPTAAIEALRQRVDRLADRPIAALLALGKPADTHGPVAYATRRLAVGGVRAVSLDGDADPVALFVATGAGAVVLCGSYQAIESSAGSLVDRLRAAGARSVLVATGATDADALGRAMGADGALSADGNLLATLETLLRGLGVPAKEPAERAT